MTAEGAEPPAEGGERTPTSTPATGASSVIEVAPVKISGIRAIQEATRLLVDPETSLEDRIALYAALYNLQLDVNRTLRKAKGAIAYRMFMGGIRAAGDVRLKHVARKVAWPVNDRVNWTDDDVQRALAGLQADPETADYIRFVPRHLEVDTVALAAAMHGQVLVDRDGRTIERIQATARGLYREMQRRGWRRELESEETIEVVRRAVDSPKTTRDNRQTTEESEHGNPDPDVPG